MASETGIKWLFALIIYFALMSIIVLLVSDVTPMTSSGGIVTEPAGVRCGLPRTTYEIDLGATDKALIITSSDSASGDVSRSGTVWLGSIECEYSTGQLGQTQCEALSGCSWTEDTWFWFFGTGNYQCVGEFNYTWIDPADVNYVYPMNYIDYTNNTQGICAYSSVLNNSTLCSQMGCSWGYKAASIDVFGVDDIELNVGMFGKLWNVIKQLFTFSFPFGFESDAANFILNLIIFYLPLIGLALAIVAIFRG